MPPAIPSAQQTAVEKFLLGVATPLKWMGFVLGSVGLLPLVISLFLTASPAKAILTAAVGGSFAVFALTGLLCTVVKSGLIHGWASMRELKALMRREQQITRLMQQYQDHLELRKASDDLLRELGAPSETLTRIRETSAELERLRVQRERIMQG